MKICAICPTCNRPELLGRAIRAFEKQTYEDRFLIIVDDLGQYRQQTGDRWQLVSFPRRVLSLGEKNNICAALAPPDTYAYAKWDDDDIYYPWHLEATVDALSRGDFVQPRHAIDFWNGKWIITETFNKQDPERFCYHGCWAYTRALFAAVGGYRNRFAGDDGEFQNRMLKCGIKSVDIDRDKYKPSYKYNRPLTNRISEMGDDHETYLAMAGEYAYVGTVPTWEDDSVFEQPIPTEIIKRQW